MLRSSLKTGTTRLRSMGRWKGDWLVRATLSWQVRAGKRPSFLNYLCRADPGVLPRLTAGEAASALHVRLRAAERSKIDQQEFLAVAEPRGAGIDQQCHLPLRT